MHRPPLLGGLFYALIGTTVRPWDRSRACRSGCLPLDCPGQASLRTVRGLTPVMRTTTIAFEPEWHAASEAACQETNGLN